MYNIIVNRNDLSFCHSPSSHEKSYCQKMLPTKVVTVKNYTCPLDLK